MSFNILLMVVALSVDIFAACTAYGASGIILSAKQIAVLNGICSLCLGIALVLGGLIDCWIPERFTKGICFYSLIFLGGVKLADAGLRHYRKHHKNIHRDICFGIAQLRFVVSIYCDPLEADADQNHSLSWRETIFFSLAMSIDCLITGVMAAFMKLPVLLTIAALFLIGEAAAIGGLWVGKKINNHCSRDISWIGGVIFVLLAVMKR